MKEHITPKQANLLSESEFYSLFEEIVQRKDWAKYHHKKVTIAKLLEILKKQNQLSMISTDNEWNIKLFNYQEYEKNEKNHKFEIRNIELLDGLFDGLLWHLNKKGNK